VNEVNSESVDIGAEIREPIERPFLCAPIESGSPVFGQLAHVWNAEPVGPVRIVQVVDPPSSCEPRAKVVENVLLNCDCKRVRCHRNAFEASRKRIRRQSVCQSAESGMIPSPFATFVSCNLHERKQGATACSLRDVLKIRNWRPHSGLARGHEVCQQPPLPPLQIRWYRSLTCTACRVPRHHPTA
jgi:hypothetical protein